MPIGGEKRRIVFQVAGDPTMALQTAQSALSQERFKIAPVDQWTVRASRGNKAGAFLFGAFAPFVEVNLLARSAPEPGVTIIEMDQLPAGCLFAGGVLGARRSSKHVDTARDVIKAAYEHAGVFRGLSEG